MVEIGGRFSSEFKTNLSCERLKGYIDNACEKIKIRTIDYDKLIITHRHSVALFI